jgi:2'-5' RNA ligase
VVFGCNAISLPEYTEHIAAISAKSNAIHFSCRYAMLGTDFEDSANVFLVHDEGYSKISLLHDRLYTGLLRPFHRLDIPFIPHITIGTLKDRVAARALCDNLNREGVRIEGALRALRVVSLEDGKLKNISSHELGEG